MKRLILTLLIMWTLLGVARMASALPTANSIITAQTPTRAIASLGPTASCTGSGTPYTCCTGSGAGCVAGTLYTVFSGATNASKCNSLTVANTDGSATHLITFDDFDGTVDHLLFQLTTASPSGAGTTNLVNTSAFTTAVFAGLPPDSDGNPYITINNGDILKWKFATAITSGAEIDVYGNCANF